MPALLRKPNAGMQAVDTNIIVRYLLRDHPAQAEKARRLIGREPVFIPRTVMLEAEWVLRAVYGLSADEIIPSLRALAGLPDVSVEDAGVVARALDWAEAGMDFADALHLAASAECSSFLTFDQRFARAGTRLGYIQVTAP
jgi:predicted nucleic-acid-binding protein